MFLYPPYGSRHELLRMLILVLEECVKRQTDIRAFRFDFLFAKHSLSGRHGYTEHGCLLATSVYPRDLDRLALRRIQCYRTRSARRLDCGQNDSVGYFVGRLGVFHSTGNIDSAD